MYKFFFPRKTIKIGKKEFIALTSYRITFSIASEVERLAKENIVVLTVDKVVTIKEPEEL